MASQAEVFALDEQVVFRGRQMRVSGRVQFEASSGQITRRYLLMDPTGAPVIVEEGDGRFAMLRPFPPAARFKAANDAIAVGTEKYTLVGVRRLKVTEVGGNVPGAAAKSPLILSGMFEGLMGTLMREMVPGTATQEYYLVKPLADGEVLSASRHAAQKDAQGRAAGERALKAD